MITFALNANDWPASPLPFKITNLVIHLVNGALLLILLAELGRAIAVPCAQRWLAATAGAATWLLHPLLASTVLYVVQREAMLPATFICLGMLGWLRARRAYADGGGNGWLLALCILGCTALATLCKANGILLPLLILVAEATLPPLPAERGKAWRFALRACCVPVACIVTATLLYLAFSGGQQSVLEVRSWSVAQRLLTEPTILWQYAGQLWFLLPTGGSLFHDRFSAATDLLHPWYSLPLILAAFLVITMAWRVRRTHPALALAVLFFACGHLIESTSIALELYFEHRNYVPAMVMFWPAALLFARHAHRRWPYALALAVFGVAAWLTHVQAQLWGDPLAQAREWVRLAPGAARAQAYAAQVELANGRVGDALERLSKVRDKFPQEPQVQMAWVDARCAAGQLTRGDVAGVATSLGSTERLPGPELVSWVSQAIDAMGTSSCAGLDAPSIQAWLDEATGNASRRGLSGREQDLLYLNGKLALAEHKPDLAKSAFDRALATDPRPQVALNQAALLGQAGRADLALSHLNYYAGLPRAAPHRPLSGMPWVHDEVLAHQRYWETEIAHLRDTLVRDIQAGETR